MTSSRLPIAVLDTNVLISGVLSDRGAPRRLLLMLRDGAYRAQVSSYLLNEYVGVLNRPYPANKLAAQRVDPAYLVETLFKDADFIINVHASTLRVRDEKDQRVLDTALSGGADFLVSGDKDFQPLVGHAQLGALRIVEPRVFLDLLQPIE